MPSRKSLRSREMLAKYAEGKGVPQFQTMQAGEKQGGRSSMDESLRPSAIGVVDIIGNQQTRVRVNAHALSVTLLFPSQKDKVRQHFVTKYLSTPCCCVGPAEPSLAPFGC